MTCVNVGFLSIGEFGINYIVLFAHKNVHLYIRVEYD